MKNYQFVALLSMSCLSVSTAYAESQCGVIIDMIKDAVYKGECLNGLAHGYGVATDKQLVGAYKGHFKSGRPNGAGTFVAGMKDGTNVTWHGSWLNGNLTGYGTYDSREYSYKGQWQSGERHGQGSQTYHEEGKVFTGTFRKDRWLKGRLSFSDGTYTQGQWAAGNGKLTGYVIETLSNGGVFKGQYQNGVRHGKGIFILKGGNPLSGVWKSGKPVSGDIMEYLQQPVPVRSNFNGSEPAKCFEIAWRHWDDGGLGLNRGSAIELCKGVDSAKKATQCFRQAWENAENGGLGLNRGGAMELCKDN